MRAVFQCRFDQVARSSVGSIKFAGSSYVSGSDNVCLKSDTEISKFSSFISLLYTISPCYALSNNDFFYL